MKHLYNYIIYILYNYITVDSVVYDFYIAGHARFIATAPTEPSIRHRKIISSLLHHC